MTKCLLCRFYLYITALSIECIKSKNKNTLEILSIISIEVGYDLNTALKINQLYEFSCSKLQILCFAFPSSSMPTKEKITVFNSEVQHLIHVIFCPVDCDWRTIATISSGMQTLWPWWLYATLNAAAVVVYNVPRTQFLTSVLVLTPVCHYAL